MTDTVAALRLLAASAQQVAQETERARARDAARGSRIIDDYPEVHPATGEEAVVRAAWSKARAIREEVRLALRAFARGGRSADLAADELAV